MIVINPGTLLINQHGPYVSYDIFSERINFIDNVLLMVVSVHEKSGMSRMKILTENGVICYTEKASLEGACTWVRDT